MILRRIVTIMLHHVVSMMSHIRDVEGEKVNYVEWLSRLGVDVKPGDISGLSTQIFNAHNKEMDKRYDDQTAR